jgi:hypothetical protein
MAKSYGVTITNLTESVVTIERGILIEHKIPRGWIQETAIQAVANCTEIDTKYQWKAPIHLEGHSSRAVIPWDGFLCAGQCSEPCRQNVRVHGIYRFVVVIVPDGKRIASPPFTIPRY